MNLPLLAPEWAVYGLIALLALAALQDSIMLKISNYLVGAVLLLAIVAAVLVGPQLSLWENGVVFATALTIGTFLFGRGILGGGDVKLFAATVLWFEFDGALRLLMYTALAGGVLAILIILARFVAWPEGLRSKVRVLQPKSGIPYGIAIAAGAMIAAATLQGSEPVKSAQNWAVPAAR